MKVPDLTLEEMLGCLHNPAPNKRSLDELEDVIDEIIARNPEWVDEIMRIVEERSK